MKNEEFYRHLVDKNNSDMKIKDGNSFISMKELDFGVMKCKNELISIGIKENMHIGVQVGRHLSFTTIFLCGILLDVIIIPIYTHIGETKLQNLVKEFDINYLFSDHNDFDHLVGGVDVFDTEIYCYKEMEHIQRLEEDVALIMQTSGTTSNSKGVMLSLENIYSNICGISEYLNLISTDRILIIKNTNHISTIVGEILLALYTKTSMTCISDSYQITHVTSILNKEEISVFFAVPYILRKMLGKNEIIPKKLRIVNFYGGKISPDEIRQIFQRYPNINFIYSYGQTEASPRVTYIERKDLETRMASCGKAISGVNVSIEAPRGECLSAYNEGEIVVSGDNVMCGYYRNESLTQSVIINNKLYTKDIGYLDEEGFLYVTGRKDNMFIIAGKNIHPEEIETLALTYHEVKEALACLKKYKQVMGIVLYVVAHDLTTVNKRDLSEFLYENLEDYKVPREIVVIQEFEKTSSGKIVRRKYEED